jgi:GNAT superfamily N-acetyltransferase
MMCIRPMRPDDLPAVEAVQAQAYGPAYLESAEVLGSRLYSGGRLCQVALLGEACVGYLLAHPWALGRIPPLHRPLEASAMPDGVFLHDLATAPIGRGRGVGQALLAAMLEGMAGRFARIGLVSLPAATGFWARQGFGPLPDRPCQPAARGYGRGAVYMERDTLSA